jgi:K+-sensing histidine kinase KdpD/putative methionine-R-sulfoxide reductase with GAF domain
VVGQHPAKKRVKTNEREGKHPRPSTLATLSILFDMAGGSVDLQKMLEATLDETLNVVGGELAQVLALDSGTGDLKVLAHQGAAGSLDAASEVSLGRALAHAVMDEGRPVVVENLHSDPRLKQLVAQHRAVHGYVGIPLIAGGSSVGALNVISSEALRLGSGDVELLSLLGSISGMAVENKRLRDELASSRMRLKERVKEISALYEVSRQALTATDLEAFLIFVARRLPAAMRHEHASAVIWCFLGGKNYLAWSENLDRPRAERLRLAVKRGRLGERIAAGQAAVEYDATEGNHPEAGLGVRSMIAVPVMVDGGMAGSVCVCYPNDTWHYMEEEKQLLLGVSEQIAQFVARDRIARESRQRAQEISSLFEVSKALASVVELEELLPVIGDTLRETLRPAEAGVLLLFDEGTGMLTVQSAFGYDMKDLRKISLQVGESISGKVFELGMPNVWATPEEAARGMANMSEHNRTFFGYASGGVDHPQSAIGVPLIYREGKIGVVTLETLRSKNGLSVSDLPFLQALAELIVINVDKIWLLNKTEQTKAVEEANRLKSELIAALAHDMRTPLASIKGYASAMLLDDVEWDDEATVEHLRIIDEEANELQTMIQDLLESSIIDAGLLQIEKEPILMPRLVEQIVGEMTRRTAKHRFVTSFGRDFPIVQADPRRITQVLRNLLDNAVRYSPDGGLVVVRGQAADEEVIVSVADEGIGIAPEHLNRLFEKFFRVKLPSGYKVRGLGLGLPVSRTIVERHGGRIWAESEIGKGTTIFFSLPMDVEATPTEED